MPGAWGSMMDEPSLEIDFESVVVRRVVTSSQHDSGISIELADRITKLRRGAMTFKEEGVHTQIIANVGSKLGEVW
jgi:hypothetical protein